MENQLTLEERVKLAMENKSDNRISKEKKRELTIKYLEQERESLSQISSLGFAVMLHLIKDWKIGSSPKKHYKYFQDIVSGKIELPPL